MTAQIVERAVVAFWCILWFKTKFNYQVSIFDYFYFYYIIIFIIVY